MPIMLLRKRIALLLACFLVASLLLVSRLAYLQVVQHDELLEWALDQRLRPFPVQAGRGTIYDRNGEKLAVSLSADAVYAVPVEVNDPHVTARRLSPLLDTPAEELVDRLTRETAFVWLDRKVEPEAAREIRLAALPGIELVEQPRRFYPNGSLAAQVLGIAGVDNQGLEGLEFYYDELLRGVPGRIEVERDATGRRIPGGTSSWVPPQDGFDIVLTIDKVLQYQMEQELAAAVERTLSDYAIGVSVRPSTGEVLAMATYPSFDPNEYQQYPVENRRNRAVANQYEPGSTFKVITASATLESGAASMGDTFFDPGRIQIGGGAVSCWKAGGHGSQSFVEVVENSCNPVFAQWSAELMGPTVFYPYIRGFGIGSELGIDFPGEATGQAPQPGSIKYGELLQWANIGFGQGVAVTPLQLVMAAAAVANDGVMMRPHFLHSVLDAQGRVVEQFASEPIRQVISEETADEMRRVLRSVVVNGSGKPADIEGYRVAGKTGTAEVPEGGVYTDKRIASFVGFAPADEPEIVTFVMLYNLKVQPKFGGVNAAPVVGRLIEDALGYLGVPRRDDPDSEALDTASGRVRVPNVRNLPLEAAIDQLEAAGLRVKSEGSEMGDFVAEQVPAPGAEMPQGGTVIVRFYQDVEYQDPARSVTVPDVVGLPVKEAAVRLSDVGLRIRVEGSGVAARQTPEGGLVTEMGDVVNVVFREQAAD